MENSNNQGKRPDQVKSSMKAFVYSVIGLIAILLIYLVTIDIRVLYALLVLAVVVMIWLVITAKKTPIPKQCPECKRVHPSYYFTEEGICQHCDYTNKATNSMGYPKLEHYNSKPNDNRPADL